MAPHAYRILQTKLSINCRIILGGKIEELIIIIRRATKLTLSDRIIPIGITNFLTSSASINTIKCLMIPFGVIKS
jgi:hypothetical protein